MQISQQDKGQTVYYIRSGVESNGCTSMNTSNMTDQMSEVFESVKTAAESQRQDDLTNCSLNPPLLQPTDTWTVCNQWTVCTVCPSAHEGLWDRFIMQDSRRSEFQPKSRIHHFLLFVHQGRVFGLPIFYKTGNRDVIYGLNVQLLSILLTKLH